MSGDFVGSNYDNEFVGDLVSFVANDGFQTKFETFFLTYALEFTNDEEHKLRYTELYTEFHEMFEMELEKFCSMKKCTEKEFMSQCRIASTDDPKAKHYIDILLSSVEYDTFVKLMKIMRPVAMNRLAMQQNALKADSKNVIEDIDEDYDNDGKVEDSSSKAASKYSEEEEEMLELNNSGSKRDEDDVDNYSDSKGSTRSLSDDGKK